MTIDEVRKESRVLRNRVRCVVSDQYRDVRRVYYEHRRHLNPQVDELRRLRERVNQATETIARLEEETQKLELELQACLNAPQIKKMLDLIRRTNGLKRSRHDKIGHMLSRITSSRTSTLRFTIAGYRNEIASLRRLMAKDFRAFRKREEELQAGIRKSCSYFEQFLQHRVRGHEILDESYKRLEELRAMERHMGGDHKVQRLSEKAQQLMELMLSMPPELIKIALQSQKQGEQ